MDSVTTRIFPPGTIDESKLTYVVIGAQFQGEWIFVRHHERSTWEMPAGHIENHEAADQAAVRELCEETGAIRSSLDHIHDYSVTTGGHTGYGRLYAATVLELESKLEHEIEELQFSEKLPPELTYPEVQAILFNQVKTYF